MPPRVFTLTPNPSLDRTLTVPEVRLDEVLRAGQSRVDPGGKGFNVARALKQLGMESLAIAFLGGANGAHLGRLMAAHGVATRAVPIADESRTCYVVTDAGGNHHLKVNEPGPVVTERELQALTAAVEELAKPGDYWVLSGSLPRGVSDDFFERLIRLLHAHAARPILDASGAALARGLTAAPFMIKPNAEEAAEILGAPVDSPVEAARAAVRFCKAGVGIAAISLGADGLVVADRDMAVYARPPAVRALNAVGAGDATVTGMLWALVQALPLGEVARWGAACGTAAAMRPGTDFAALAEVTAVAELVVTQVLEPG